MRKEIILGLGLLAVITMALFWQTFADALRGMSVVEVTELIWMFVIKATVIGICAWMLTTVPEIIRPWVKTFRQKQRQARRWVSGPNARWQGSAAPRMPRLTAEQKFWLMMARANGKRPKTAERDSEPPVEMRW